MVPRLPGREVDALLDQRAEERPVREPRQAVVMRAVLDLVHLPADAVRDPAQDRYEREEEQQQRRLEDPGDREERGVRGLLDRRVVLVEDDDAGAVRDGDGRERPKHLQRLVPVRERCHVAADRAGPCLPNVAGASPASADEAMVGAVRDGAVGCQERRADEALVEYVCLEQPVERRPAQR